MIDPAIRTEAAHAARRDGRAALAAEEWPYPPDDLARDGVIAAAIERAAARVGFALERASSP